ncbi:hypothetical protein PFNF135_00668 [Plasmodium falciparum NF135/5.C10]|uniref:Plasmodium falciparum erythrocyte membrane protein 1 acidic terminal segment domain-containing protein n=1 Tax=Plasmodium falciparum NF135/5.C10 TaxID=1036726 RepID=W4INQ6_PLAFA|nr:hypothetical protein PFNF135_00668 [Plasmodium falciparum NF135/5.C10]
MNIYHVKMLIFNFLINILVSPHNENYLNNHYNVSLIQNHTKRTTINSRLLAQTKNHNPHYHNDPELKEIIDKMNEEAIKKYQQTHDPYKQLKDVVEKNGTKYTGGKDAEPMSTLEKELLETYEEMFGNESDMLKSGMYSNDKDGSDKSSTCECTDINSTDLTKRKDKDMYLKHLKHRCIGGICSCTLGSALLTWIEWTIEHNEDLLDIPSSSHDDILKIKDETYNIISTNNLYSYENNDITPHQLGLPNIIPSGIIKHQNNGLRTNISMDIPFDEKNYNNVVTTSIIGDDQVENSYNL